MTGWKENEYGLTVDEVKELASIANQGADIWGYTNACLLRSVQKKAPKLIYIGPAKQEVPGHMRQPYFGAQATISGIDFLDSLKVLV